MATTLVVIRNRVRARLNEFEQRPTKVSTGIVTIDNAIADVYQMLAARLPAPRLYAASAFTISAGAQTFALPTTIGTVENIQYGGDVRIQLVSDGTYLLKSSREEIESLRHGDTSTAGGKPCRFCLYEESDTQVQGECWERAKDAEACNLYASINPDEIRNAASMDAAVIQVSNFGSVALVWYTAALLLASMTEEDAALRRLDKGVAPAWMKEAGKVLYEEEARRHAAEDSGRSQRWVS